MEDWSVKNKDIPELFQMWGDLFRFQKKFLNAPAIGNIQEPTYWQQVVKEQALIDAKYNTELCASILVAILDDFKLRSKKKENE